VDCTIEFVNFTIEEDEESKSEGGGVTEVTMTVGSRFTPLYMAPEVSEGHYGPKVDVYSFGLILYEIIVGNGLFSSERDKRKLFLNLQIGWRRIDKNFYYWERSWQKID
jgi:serine/threonine protein kinase